jgi:hypothetical protein
LFAPLQEIGILPRHIEANLYVPKLFAQAAFKKERRPPAAPKARLRHDAPCRLPARSGTRVPASIRFCGARREPAAGRARAAAEQRLLKLVFQRQHHQQDGCLLLLCLHARRRALR